jgi:hypothetical protein
MKLKGFPSHEIRYLMELAKVQQRENEPIKIKLYIKSGEDIKAIKSELEKKYKVKRVDTFEFLSKKGEDTLVFADIPAKNLRKAIKKDYVSKYGWPEELETLSYSEKILKKVVITTPKASENVEILNESRPRPDKIIDSIGRKGARPGDETYD